MRQGVWDFVLSYQLVIVCRLFLHEARKMVLFSGREKVRKGSSPEKGIAGNVCAASCVLELTHIAPKS